MGQSFDPTRQRRLGRLARPSRKYGPLPSEEALEFLHSPLAPLGQRGRGVRGSTPGALKPSFATPSPVTLRLVKAPERDTLSRRAEHVPYLLLDTGGWGDERL